MQGRNPLEQTPTARSSGGTSQTTRQPRASKTHSRTFSFRSSRDVTELPGWGLDGRALHDTRTGVPPDRWCITREDFKYIRRQIKEAVQDGRIQPSPRDDFDPEDDVVGPNMHSVVENLVRPVTAEAGDMSWALLCHPDGLQCDFFITHSWAEGAYEFIDKVLTSWPPGLRNAWCCIFSNPQNLDIGGLICEPQASPFAKALESASYMMVVSTKKCSIYARIWCVYEAYLACKLRKVIFMATPPLPWRRLGKAAIAASVFLALGCAVGQVCSSETDSLCGRIDFAAAGDLTLRQCAQLLVIFACLALSALSALAVRQPRVLFWMNGAGLALSSFGLYLHLILWRSFDSSNPFRFQVAVLSFFVVFFLMSEMDRLHFNRLRLEAEALRESFTSIADAKASQEEDRRRILRDIGDQIEVVDGSIRVLLAAGMSTADLRGAAEAGADVTSMADLRLATAWAGLSGWILLNFFDYECIDLTVCSESDWAFACTWTLIAVFVLLWIRADVDRKAWIGSVVSKCGILCMVLFVGLLPAIEHFAWSDKRRLRSTWFRLCISIVGLFALACSAAGVQRVAELPYCGPWLAEALGSGCRPACRCQRRKTHSAACCVARAAWPEWLHRAVGASPDVSSTCGSDTDGGAESIGSA
mmetsp:Transcript_134622/g.340182  ORF Transcript_134622/g.340182 Transcript_134622/m.340182 type:complete len:644 (+) Transcript_134622:196-2127(+)